MKRVDRIPHPAWIADLRATAGRLGGTNDQKGCHTAPCSIQLLDQLNLAIGQLLAPA